jgi:hypothetical protein
MQKWALDVVQLECGGVAPAKKVKKVMWQGLQELGVVLMKAQAKCIFSHAAMATRRRFISSRERPAVGSSRAGTLSWRARQGR